MAEKVKLRVMRCPMCGGDLKVKNDTDEIVCVYCGNLIVPVTEAASQNENPAVSGGVFRIAGMKTPASALAYTELFFEEYDWSAFTYARALSVTEIDELAKSLKTTSADDKNTWFVCFQAVSVPLLRKVDGCKKILEEVLEGYKKENLDAYSKFDAYKRIATAVRDHKKGILENLDKITANAKKYGASDDEVRAMYAEMDKIKQTAKLEWFEDVESIPEIQVYNREKDARIVAELAQKGINAAAVYENAKVLMREKKYVAALDALRLLNGYADSKQLAEKLDRYYLISDVLEIDGNLYYFMYEGENKESLSLHAAAEGKISEKAIIRNIKNIVTNYADTLYYLDTNLKLKRCNLSDGTIQTYEKMQFRPSAYVRDQSVYLLTANPDESAVNKRSLVKVDLATGGYTVLLEGVDTLVSFNDNKMIYQIKQKNREKEEDEYSYDDETPYKLESRIFNLDTREMVVLGAKKLAIEGFLDNYVVYTQESPNKHNKNLYIRELKPEAEEILVEQNIYRFCDIIADKLFYYIGNSHKQTLININCDGTDRREWQRYISEVLFEQGGWVYFIRRVGYNAILCKAHLDGSKYSVIAADIDKFIDIKNGYLYYINDDEALVKVRMDGSNLQKLCEDVVEVLAVKENKIIFISEDDEIKTGEGLETKVKTVNSIYAVDFTGGGKIKLAYDVGTAKEYDDNTVYYIAAQEIKKSYDEQEAKREKLYKLDVDTYRTEELLDMEVKEEKKKTKSILTVLVIAIIAFLFGFMGMGAESEAMCVLGFVTGVICILIAGVMKLSKDS